MGLWKRCVRKILPGKVRNEVIREEGEVEKSNKTRTYEKRLMWYGDVRRLPRRSSERQDAGKGRDHDESEMRALWN
jgi:hypothetical protein